jgi:hypothetical protein
MSTVTDFDFDTLIFFASGNRTVLPEYVVSHVLALPHSGLTSTV